MSYKLTGFTGTGRAEPIKFLLALAKVKYTDNVITMEQWGSLKKGTRWGVLPELEFENKEIGQSQTIMRFLARKYEFAGANEWEATLCDEIVDALSDLILEMYKFFLAPDAIKKDEARKDLLDKQIPKYFLKINSMAIENGGVWLVGKSLTWADMFLANIINNVELYIDKDVLQDYPKLKKINDKFFALPEIQEHVNNRKA